MSPHEFPDCKRIIYVLKYPIERVRITRGIAAVGPVAYTLWCGKYSQCTTPPQVMSNQITE